MFIDTMASPIGNIEINANDEGVTKIQFIKKNRKKTYKNAITDRCKQQLKEYFNKQRKVFDFPLAAQGTDFQKATWASLLQIPYGKTASYRDIAMMINRPKTMRAVGAANGKNPIAIVVPCHRIIGSNGLLTGYAGGLERKAWLLEHEKQN